MKPTINDKLLTIDVTETPKTWYGQLLAISVTGLLIWLSIVFFTLFLIIFSVIATSVLVSLFWQSTKKTDANASNKTYEAYTTKKNGTKHTIITMKGYDQKQ